ncbi:hypothetical protein ABZP36_005348 [Zizania latifolia]
MTECCSNTYMHEREDVHRWLPSEILSDIGIVDIAERRRLAVVEDLSARLAGVLGCTVERSQRTQQRAVPQCMVANSHPRRRAPPAEGMRPFLSNGGRMLDLAVALPRFAPARRPPLLAAGAGAPPLPPAKRSGGGTGVFLPRTEVYNYHACGAREAATAPAGGAHAGTKPRYHGRQQPCWSRQRRRGEAEEAPSAAMRSSRRHFHVHAHAVTAAAAEIILEQPPRTANAAAPHACAELALPREWVY